MTDCDSAVSASSPSVDRARSQREPAGCVGQHPSVSEEKRSGGSYVLLTLHPASVGGEVRHAEGRVHNVLLVTVCSRDACVCLQPLKGAHLVSRC